LGLEQFKQNIYGHNNDFQFPLLGLLVDRFGYEYVAVHFQFPLLGLINLLVILKAQKTFQFPLLGLPHQYNILIIDIILSIPSFGLEKIVRTIISEKPHVFQFPLLGLWFVFGFFLDLEFCLVAICIFRFAAPYPAKGI